MGMRGTPTTWARAVGGLTAGAAVALLAGCGGGSSTPAATPAATTPAATTPAATTPAATTPAATTTATTSRSARTMMPTRPTTTRPTSSPAPSAGTVITGEDLTGDRAAALQAAVDAGHQPWRLDVGMVAAAFVADRFGWRGARVALADPHTAEVTDAAGGRMLTLQLRQPVRDGQGGIWVVDSGVWLN